MAPAPDPLSLPLARRIDRACDRFEAAWRQSNGPTLENYLYGWRDRERELLFDALLEIELELLASAGKALDMAAYCGRFPEYANQVLEAFARRNPASRLRPDRLDTDRGDSP
jgi:hypothetical protein